MSNIIKEFIEKGAELEHQRWAKWQAYLHSKCVPATFSPDWVGALIIPAESVKHWIRQINTPYADLSEQEKESDRREARTYLPLVEAIRSQTIEEVRKWIEDRGWVHEMVYNGGDKRDFSGSHDPAQVIHRKDLLSHLDTLQSKEDKTKE